jgi:hypothetical protein
MDGRSERVREGGGAYAACVSPEMQPSRMNSVLPRLAHGRWTVGANLFARGMVHPQPVYRLTYSPPNEFGPIEVGA